MTMTTRSIAAGLAMIASAAAAQVPGPPRPLTDPARIVATPGPAPAQIAIEALFDARDSAGGGWLEGGRLVVSANLDGRFNLWRIDRAGAAPVRLSTSDERQLAPLVAPDRRTILFETDVGGGEIYDLIRLAPDGSTDNVTGTPDISESGARFSRDGRMIALSYRPRGRAAADLAVMTLADRKPRVLTAERDPAFRWVAVAFTPDGSAVIANRLNVQTTVGEIWRVPVAGGTADRLGPAGPGVYTAASDLSPDGRTIAFASNARAEQAQAGLLTIADGRVRWLKPSPWRQTANRFSPDGRQLLFAVNADGRTDLFLQPVAGGAPRAIRMPPGANTPGGIAVFTPDSRQLLVSHQASHTPADLWRYDVRTGQAQRITRFASPALDAAAPPASQIVRYRSKDGTVISALLWVPNGLRHNGRAPAVVIAHGGPTGQTTDVFNRTSAALSARGYVVIAPNFRGSTGYGKAFQAANVGDLGGGDLDDLVAGVDFLAATGYVDRARVGITGGSYGGYLTVMALARTPDIWAAGVDLFGVLDWRTLARTTDPALRAYVRALLGDPDRDAAAYDRASATTWLHQIRAPIQVQQGDNDIRVPRSEAVALVAALEKSGRTVEAHYYPHEGHGFFRRENQIDSLQRTIDWFDRYLKR